MRTVLNSVLFKNTKLGRPSNKSLQLLAIMVPSVNVKYPPLLKLMEGEDVVSEIQALKVPDKPPAMARFWHRASAHLSRPDCRHNRVRPAVLRRKTNKDYPLTLPRKTQ